MTGVWTGIGTAVAGVATAATANRGGGGGGGDAQAAMLQAAQDAALMREMNAYNNPDLYSNMGSEERTFVPAVKAQKARPAKYDKDGNLIRPAQAAVKGQKARWVVTQKLAEPLKKAQDFAMGAQADWAGKAAAQGDFAGPERIQFDPTGAQKYSTQFYNRAMDRVAPEQDFQQDAMNTRLIQQGLQPGTAAYDRAMKNLMTSQGDVRTRAALDAEMAGQQAYLQDYSAQNVGQAQNWGQMRAEYGMPMEQAMGFGAMAGDIQPNLPGAGRGSVGRTGIDYMQLSANKQAADNAAAAQRAAAFGTMAEGIGQAWGAYNKPKTT